MDLQLGGSDEVSNMNPLDASVNRSMGAQIQGLIRNLDPGTTINRISFSSSDDGSQ